MGDSAGLLLRKAADRVDDRALRRLAAAVDLISIEGPVRTDRLLPVAVVLLRAHELVRVAEGASCTAVG